MSIRVECDACGKVLNAKDDSAGKKAKCPGCDKILQIPAQEIVNAEASGQDDFGAASSDDDGGGADDKRPCPACGEDIKKNALKCRFCGEIFDKSLKQKSKSAAAGGDDDNLSGGEWALGILCSGIACIMGIVWMIQGKPKGIKLLGLSLVVQAVVFVVQMLIESANQNQRFGN